MSIYRDPLRDIGVIVHAKDIAIKHASGSFSLFGSISNTKLVEVTVLKVVAYNVKCLKSSCILAEGKLLIGDRTITFFKYLRLVNYGIKLFQRESTEISLHTERRFSKSRDRRRACL